MCLAAFSLTNIHDGAVRNVGSVYYVPVDQFLLLNKREYMRLWYSIRFAGNIIKVGWPIEAI